MPAGCAFLVMALRRRRQRQVQRASSAGKAVDEFVTDGLDSSKAATPSHQLSLASLDSGGAPAALHSDPLVSYIYASQLASKASQRSCTSAARSQGSGGGGVQAWEMEWADLQLQRVVGAGSFGRASQPGASTLALPCCWHLAHALCPCPAHRSGWGGPLPPLASAAWHSFPPLGRRCTWPAGAPSQWLSRCCWYPAPRAPTWLPPARRRRRWPCRPRRWQSWKRRQACWPASGGGLRAGPAGQRAPALTLVPAAASATALAWAWLRCTSPHACQPPPPAPPQAPLLRQLLRRDAQPAGACDRVLRPRLGGGAAGPRAGRPRCGR